MNDKIKSILLELESLRLTKDSELSAVQMEYDGLAQNIKFLEDVVSSKNQEIQALHLKMADLEDELSTTKLHYQPYEGQVEELEHTVDGLKDQVTEKASEVERQRAELVHLQSANRRTKADLEKFEKAHQDLQTLLNQLQSFPRQWSVLGKDITNTQLKSKLEGLEHVFADMKCDQTQLEDKVKSLERALDKERFQHNHLQDLFMSEKKKLSHTEGCLAKSEENGRNLRERLKDEKEKQGMLMEQYTSLQQNNYQLEERENQLKQRLNEVRARLLAVEDEKEQEHISVERLREELGKCKSLVAQLKDSNSDLSAQLRQAQKQVSGQWDELQRERIEAHRQLEAAQKCTQLELELAEEKLEVQRVHGNLLREREDHCNTREEAARLAEGLMDMKSRLAKLIKDNCELQLEVSDSQVSDVEELDRIASVLNGAQTKFNAYVLEIKHLKGEVEKTKDFSGEAEEEVERLKNSLASAQKAHLITQKELHSTKSSLTRSQDLAKKLQEDCDAMANQVSLWTREQRMSQENFAERIRVLEKEIATLRADKQWVVCLPCLYVHTPHTL
jgi:chromosome segregation ATPase